MQNLLKEENARSPLRPRRGRSASLARPEPYPGAHPRTPRVRGLPSDSQGSQHDGLTQLMGLPEADPGLTQGCTPSPPPPLAAPTRSLTSQLMEAETDPGPFLKAGGGPAPASGAGGKTPTAEPLGVASRDEDLEEVPVLSDGSLGPLAAGVTTPGLDGLATLGGSDGSQKDEEREEEEAEEKAEAEVDAGHLRDGRARKEGMQLEEDSEAEEEDGEDRRSEDEASATGMSAESDMTATIAFKPLTAHRPDQPQAPPPPTGPASEEEDEADDLKSMLRGMTRAMKGIASKQDSQHELLVQMGQKVDRERVERIKEISQLRAERKADLTELRTQFAELLVSDAQPGPRSAARPGCGGFVCFLCQ